VFFLGFFLDWIEITLIVLPVAYLWFGASEETRAIVPQERSTCDDQEPVRTT